MSCSNCYNGCTEIVSDKCVRYTGLDVPVLGIQTGDSLSFVEQALIEFLTSTLDGTGIVITLPEGTYCELVTSYLPTCGDITAVNLFEALVKSACDLQTQVDAVVAELAVLNADYDVDCLTGVTSSSDTHNVLQAVITKLCEVDASLAALALDVSTNYVKLADLDALIQAYINSTATSTQYYTRMIPYTAVEYYGSLSYFNATGVGNPLLGFEDIYLCNGLNGTPDKRGRVPVGAIQLVPGGTPDPAVNPSSSPYNYDYAVGDTYGANSITLSGTQIPAHTHIATSVVTETAHDHFIVRAQTITDDSSNSINGLPNGTIAGHWLTDNNDEYDLQGNATAPANAGRTSATTTGITVATTNSSFGGGLAHSNAQPAVACYYIMYIPTVTP